LKLLLICEDVGAIGPAPKREHVWVFQQQQLLWRFARPKTLDCFFLQADTVVVWNKAKPSSFASSLSLRCLRCHRDA
jgi:hypothetical protein